MDGITVFSRNQITCREMGNIKADAAVSEHGCRYLLVPREADGDYLADAVNFIFEGIIQSVTEHRLRAGGLGDGRCAPEFFSEKLSAYLYITGSRNKIDSIVRSVLKEGNVINIEGVVNFRLRELSSDISAFFDMLFYEYRVQKQYDDFITLVRDYIELESPKEAVVHIVFRRSGFMLYNAKKANITYQALKKYKSDSGFSEGSLNDFLISSLLYFLPKSIILHVVDKPKNGVGFAGNRIIETIRTIFKERVVSCELCGCELCGCEASFEEAFDTASAPKP